jgi:hypothetical protein
VGDLCREHTSGQVLPDDDIVGYWVVGTSLPGGLTVKAGKVGRAL